MSAFTKRSTVYFDPSIHKILKIKALEASCSVSDLVNQAVLHELGEDAEDLEAFAKRVYLFQRSVYSPSCSEISGRLFL